MIGRVTVHRNIYPGTTIRVLGHSYPVVTSLQTLEHPLSLVRETVTQSQEMEQKSEEDVLTSHVNVDKILAIF